jgi:hypothetical protein
MRTSVGKVRWRLVTLLGVVSVAAGVAACGGGNGDKRLSSEEFVAEGNAICAEANEKIEALGEFPVSPEEAATYLDEFAEILDREAESFSALTPPEDLEETVDQAIALIKEVSQVAREASEPAAAGDMAAVLDVAPQVAALEEELDALTVGLGLDECN